MREGFWKWRLDNERHPGFGLDQKNTSAAVDLPRQCFRVTTHSPRRENPFFPTAYPGLVQQPFGARLSLTANAVHCGIFAFLWGRRIADWFFEPLIPSQDVLMSSSACTQQISIKSRWEIMHTIGKTFAAPVGLAAWV
jgi:hypothetical protein